MGDGIEVNPGESDGSAVGGGQGRIPKIQESLGADRNARFRLDDQVPVIGQNEVVGTGGSVSAGWGKREGGVVSVPPELNGRSGLGLGPKARDEEAQSQGEGAPKAAKTVFQTLSFKEEKRMRKSPGCRSGSGVILTRRGGEVNRRNSPAARGGLLKRF